jgi:hypothetical protein
MKRIVIVIVAGLAFGVTAAYAATGHSKSSPARTPHTSSQHTFAVPAASTGTTTESDDPVTDDQGDDRGQVTQPSSEPASSGQDESSQDDQGDDSQGDDSQAGDSEDDNSQVDNSQSGQQDDSQSDQQDDSQSGDSGGDASGD